MYNIGSRVKLEVRGRSNLLTSKTGYEISIVEGTVVKTPSYVEYEAVAVRTGNPNFPLSIVKLSNIVGYVPAETKSLTETHSVVSGANTYTVTVESGKVSCSCVGFQFRRYCKHSNLFKKG